MFLGTDFGGAAFPNIGTDLEINWGFTACYSAMKGWDSDGNLPTVSFTNVTLDLGTFVGNFVQPIVKDIEGILKPVEPILDIMTARIPIISDLAGSDVSLLSLAAAFGDVPESAVDDFVSFYHEYKSLKSLLGAAANGMITL
jgi:hypothetical protein